MPRAAAALEQALTGAHTATAASRVGGSPPAPVRRRSGVGVWELAEGAHGPSVLHVSPSALARVRPVARGASRSAAACDRSELGVRAARASFHVSLSGPRASAARRSSLARVLVRTVLYVSACVDIGPRAIPCAAGRNDGLAPRDDVIGCARPVPARDGPLVATRQRVGVGGSLRSAPGSRLQEPEARIQDRPCGWLWLAEQLGLTRGAFSNAVSDRDRGVCAYCERRCKSSHEQQ